MLSQNRKNCLLGIQKKQVELYRKKLCKTNFLFCDEIGINEQVFALEHYITDLASIFFEEGSVTMSSSGDIISPNLKKFDQNEAPFFQIVASHQLC